MDNYVRRYALFLLASIIPRCRSPPLVLYFLILNHEMEDKPYGKISEKDKLSGKVSRFE